MVRGLNCQIAEEDMDGSCATDAARWPTDSVATNAPAIAPQMSRQLTRAVPRRLRILGHIPRHGRRLDHRVRARWAGEGIVGCSGAYSSATLGHLIEAPLSGLGRSIA